MTKLQKLSYQDAYNYAQKRLGHGDQPYQIIDAIHEQGNDYTNKLGTRLLAANNAIADYSK